MTAESSPPSIPPAPSQPCLARARYGHPLCRVHRPDTAGDRVPWHLYAPYFTADETTALRHLLDTLAAEDALAGEISTARIQLRRLI